VSDIPEYCRQVEAHLTRINGGHLVRVVGPGFALVRQWALDEVPLSVVFKGIEQKADRHKLGAARRPLRIEFCEADVREVYDGWRRAIGVATATSIADEDAPVQDVPATGSRRRPASRVLDKALDRLGRLAGRLELPDAFRDSASHAIEQLSSVREGLAGARGSARDPWLEQLPHIERTLLDQARLAMEPSALRALTAQAEQELLVYRDRLSAEAWGRAVEVTVDRGVREHFGLPTLEL
jgi:hypothetical protein